jgi:chromate transport protein ChrA
MNTPDGELRLLHASYDRLRWRGWCSRTVLFYYMLGSSIVLLVSAAAQYGLASTLIDMQYILNSDHIVALAFPDYTVVTEEFLAVGIGNVIAYIQLQDGIFLMMMTIWFRRTIHEAEEGRTLLLWVSYAVTTPLMISVIGQLSGARNMHYHVCIMTIFAVMMLTGYALQWLRSERMREVGLARGSRWTPPMQMLFGLQCVAFLMVFATVYYYFFKAVETSDPPAFVYGAVFGLLLFMLPFPVILVLEMREAINMHAALFWYVTAALVAKLFLSWNIFGGAAAQ